MLSCVKYTCKKSEILQEKGVIISIVKEQMQAYKAQNTAQLPTEIIKKIAQEWQAKKVHISA